jgi:hypothetical protein
MYVVSRYDNMTILRCFFYQVFALHAAVVKELGSKYCLKLHVDWSKAERTIEWLTINTLHRLS